MDIKPFQQPDLNWFTDIGPAWIIALGVLLLLLFVGVVRSFTTKDYNLAVVLMAITGTFGMLIPMTIGSLSEATVRHENYANYVNQFKDALKEEGFQLVTGTPNLNPNAMSSMLLSYEDGKFNCTLFTPEDVYSNILFSCGETKLTLEQIKETNS